MRAKHMDSRTYLISTVHHINEEDPEVEVLAKPGVLVQLGEIHEDVIVGNTVEETESDDGEDSPEGIPE